MAKEPYLAHSELTHEIYIVSGRSKYLVTDQAVKAVKAIQALSQEPKYWMDNDGKVHKLVPMAQEPCTDTVSIRKDILKCRVGKIVAYNVEWLREHWQMEMDIVCGVKPCEDAISRQAVLDKTIRKNNIWNSITNAEGKNLEEIIFELPSVTQKSGKWDRLYSWLNDMRLGIAPDETVTDIDERHCRESQTDILDEIMEWMIKAESEEQTE